MAGSMESAKQKTWFAPAGSNPKGTGSFAFGIMKCSATRVACSSHSLRRWRTPSPTLPQGGGRKSEALAAKGEGGRAKPSLPRGREEERSPRCQGGGQGRSCASPLGEGRGGGSG